MIIALRQVVSRSSKQSLRDCEEILEMKIEDEEQEIIEKKRRRKKQETKIMTEDIQYMIKKMKEK